MKSRRRSLARFSVAAGGLLSCLSCADPVASVSTGATSVSSGNPTTAGDVTTTGSVTNGLTSTTGSTTDGAVTTSTSTGGRSTGPDETSLQLFAGAARIDITPELNRCDPLSPTCQGHCGDCPSLAVCTCAQLSKGDVPPPECDVDLAREQCGQCDCYEMAGYASRFGKPAVAVHDPLFVRAVVLELRRAGVDEVVDRAVFVTADKLAADVDALLEILDKHGPDCPTDDCLHVPAEHLFVSATHTHGGVRDRSVEPTASYMAWRTAATLEAVEQAHAQLEPVQLTFVRGSFDVEHAGDDLNVNRRELVRECAPGSECLPLSSGCVEGDPTRACNCVIGADPDGPSDNGVDVVSMETVSDRQPVAMLVNYGVHGTLLGEHNDLITGDLPGAIAGGLEERLGGVVLFSSAGGGDQSPYPEWHLSRAEGFGGGRDVTRERGEALVEFVATSMVPRRVQIPTAGFRGQRQSVMVPSKNGGNTELSVSVLGLAPSLAVVGLPLETSASIALTIKSGTVFGNTMLMSYTNGSRGYFVPDASWSTYPELRCYENRSAKIGRATRRKRDGAETSIVDAVEQGLATVAEDIPTPGRR